MGPDISGTFSISLLQNVKKKLISTLQADWYNISQYTNYSLSYIISKISEITILRRCHSLSVVGQ